MTIFFTLGAVFLLLVLLFFIIAMLFYFTAFFSGAPFVRTTCVVKQQLRDAHIFHDGQTVLDLGSGDGGLLRFAAHYGAKGMGWEINPFLVFWSRMLNRRSGMHRAMTMQWCNFWRHSLPPADIIVVYGIASMMKRLRDKILQEAQPGTTIVSLRFSLPGLRIQKREGSLFIYKI